MPTAHPHKIKQLAAAAGIVVLAVVYASGASSIPSEAGYSGVGPNFLPWLVATALAVFGLALGVQALGPGWSKADDGEAPDADAGTDYRNFAWVSAGLLANAALITYLGFVLSCALCFALAARGFRQCEGRSVTLANSGTDLLIGLAIAAPVFWMFTVGLNVSLPSLTGTPYL